MVPRPSACIREFRRVSQKSASDVDPGVLLGESLNARPKGTTLMARTNTVAITILELRFRVNLHRQPNTLTGGSWTMLSKDLRLGTSWQSVPSCLDWSHVSSETESQRMKIRTRDDVENDRPSFLQMLPSCKCHQRIGVPST